MASACVYNSYADVCLYDPDPGYGQEADEGCCECVRLVDNATVAGDVGHVWFDKENGAFDACHQLDGMQLNGTEVQVRGPCYDERIRKGGPPDEALGLSATPDPVECREESGTTLARGPLPPPVWNQRDRGSDLSEDEAGSQAASSDVEMVQPVSTRQD